MGLNTTGPISMGGATAGQSMNLTLGQTATTMISMNDTNVRSLLGVPTGQIDMFTARGKAIKTNYTLNVTANTNDYSVRTALLAAGWPGPAVDANVTVNIAAGVYVWGQGGVNANTNSPGLLSGTLPSFSTLNLNNAGTILGHGGTGGGGNISGTSGVAGVYSTVDLVLNNTGLIAGGGGGGSGGRYNGVGDGPSQFLYQYHGGGGGAGGGNARWYTQGTYDVLGVGAQSLGATGGNSYYVPTAAGTPITYGLGAGGGGGWVVPGTTMPGTTVTRPSATSPGISYISGKGGTAGGSGGGAIYTSGALGSGTSGSGGSSNTAGGNATGNAAAGNKQVSVSGGGGGWGAAGGSGYEDTQLTTTATVQYGTGGPAVQVVGTGRTLTTIAAGTLWGSTVVP